MAYGKNIDIGSLRWPVTLAFRIETAQTDGTGIDETVAGQLLVYASIEPIGLQSWIGTTQIDTPITHRIIIRYVPDVISMFNVIVRQRLLPDGKTTTDLFRIRRVNEIEGRQRFLAIDAELEQILTAPAS